MITIPDINELIRDLNGELFPFGWASCCGGCESRRTSASACR